MVRIQAVDGHRQRKELAAPGWSLHRVQQDLKEAVIWTQRYSQSKKLHREVFLSPVWTPWGAGVGSTKAMLAGVIWMVDT